MANSYGLLTGSASEHDLRFFLRRQRLMRSPFDDEAPPDDAPPPIAQLQADAECLRLVEYWRTEAERLKEILHALRALIPQ